MIRAMPRWSAMLALSLCATVALAATDVPDDPLDSSQWRYMKRQYFPDAKVVFDDRVKVVAPDYAEDSLATPVQVSADGLDGVERVLVIADLSPINPVLDYFPVAAKPSIGFSFKIQQATPIRAAMQTADGTWHVGGAWVDAQGGGCTAPSVGNSSAIWQSRLGEVSGRLWAAADAGEPGQRLKLRVVHPMDTGLAAGIPAFYIRDITISDFEGRTLARLAPDEPVSENPVFALDLDHDGPVTVEGRDNNGNTFSAVIPAPAS
tara:strand:- start:789 stop:1577 length:789 start_codon:yes stop_codon:yes gene_type:complete